MGPPVVHALVEFVVEQRVAVFVVSTVPEDHFRLPVRVVVTSVDELKQAGEIERVAPHEEPMCRPLRTRRKLAGVWRLLQAQSEKAVSEFVLVTLVKQKVRRTVAPYLRRFVVAIRTHQHGVNRRPEPGEERLTTGGVGL